MVCESWCVVYRAPNLWRARILVLQRLLQGSAQAIVSRCKRVSMGEVSMYAPWYEIQTMVEFWRVVCIAHDLQGAWMLVGEARSRYSFCQLVSE